MSDVWLGEHSVQQPTEAERYIDIIRSMPHAVALVTSFTPEWDTPEARDIAETLAWTLFDSRAVDMDDVVIVECLLGRGSKWMAPEFVLSAELLQDGFGEIGLKGYAGAIEEPAVVVQEHSPHIKPIAVAERIEHHLRVHPSQFMSYIGIVNVVELAGLGFNIGRPYDGVNGPDYYKLVNGEIITPQPTAEKPFNWSHVPIRELA